MAAGRGERLQAGDPRLAFRPDPRLARSILAAYEPPDEDRARARERMLAFLDERPEALSRASAEGHLTASALVVDADRRRGLLALHAKLGLWLQLGGHCDGDGNLPGVALREAIEESGVEELAIDPRPLDVDVHVIPGRPGEPEHLHLDTRFVAFAPRGARPRASAESRALAWFEPAELDGLVTDDSVRRLFLLALGR